MHVARGHAVQYKITYKFPAAWGWGPTSLLLTPIGGTKSHEVTEDGRVTWSREYYTPWQRAHAEFVDQPCTKLPVLWEVSPGP